LRKVLSAWLYFPKTKAAWVLGVMESLQNRYQLPNFVQTHGFVKYLIGSFFIFSSSTFQKDAFRWFFRTLHAHWAAAGPFHKKLRMFGGKMGSAYYRGLSRQGQTGKLRVVKASLSPQSSVCGGKGGQYV